MRAEEAKGNNKRDKLPLLSSDPANNDDNKDENALSALTNAATITKNRSSKHQHHVPVAQERQRSPRKS